MPNASDQLPSTDPMRYKDYPEAAAVRTGAKVAWRYYATKAAAEECAEIARHNARIDVYEGFDHGYCVPGVITAPGRQRFHPELWEVCVS